MTADERMRETMAASQALARCFLSQDKVICSSSFFIYNPSLIFFSISNLFNNWYSFFFKHFPIVLQSLSSSLLDIHFRVYTVMRENKELFGETSFEDVKAQMDLYKA